MAIQPNKNLHYKGEEIHYPESDGNPMADNTKQLECIVYFFINLKIRFKDTEHIFIAADHLWYPVEGDNKTRVAPDVMICFDRPRGHRGSYRQWEEGDVAPQVGFEVLSPSNTRKEMMKKRDFYEKYGVKEFIIIDPDKETFVVFALKGQSLAPVHYSGNSWQSPLLGITILSTSKGIQGLYPDGQPFETEIELKEKIIAEQQEAERQRQEAERQKQEAERQRQEAERFRLESFKKDQEIERLKAELLKSKKES